MWRALVPYLVVAATVALGAAFAYDAGAPAWTVHLALVLAGLVVLPGYLRWESREP
jgi:hypothetical protein